MKALTFVSLAFASMLATGAMAQVDESSSAESPAVESQATTTVVTGINGTTSEIVIPAALPDGRKIWKQDASQTEAMGRSGEPVAIGGLIAKMVTDAATAEEICRGGINGTDEQATGCAVRDYLYSTLAEVNVCEDRYIDEASNAFVKVYAECVAP